MRTLICYWSMRRNIVKEGGLYDLSLFYVTRSNQSCLWTMIWSRWSCSGSGFTSSQCCWQLPGNSFFYHSYLSCILNSPIVGEVMGIKTTYNEDTHKTRVYDYYALGRLIQTDYGSSTWRCQEDWVNTTVGAEMYWVHSPLQIGHSAKKAHYGWILEPWSSWYCYIFSQLLYSSHFFTENL